MEIGFSQLMRLLKNRKLNGGRKIDTNKNINNMKLEGVVLM